MEWSRPVVRWLVVSVLALAALLSFASAAGAVATCAPLQLSFVDPESGARATYAGDSNTLTFTTPEGRRLVGANVHRTGRTNGGPVTVVAHSSTLTIILHARPSEGRGQATAVQRTGGGTGAKGGRQTFSMAVYRGPSQAPVCAETAPIRGTSPTRTPDAATATSTVTPTPRPTETPRPTTTPRPTETRHPTATPAGSTPTPTAGATDASALAIVTPPGAVKRGSYASVEVMAPPGARCTITVIYKSGASHAAGLEPQTVSASGQVAWRWKVGTNTTPGGWPVDVTCGGVRARAWLTVLR